MISIIIRKKTYFLISNEIRYLERGKNANVSHIAFTLLMKEMKRELIFYRKFSAAPYQAKLNYFREMLMRHFHIYNLINR